MSSPVRKETLDLLSMLKSKPTEEMAAKNPRENLLQLLREDNDLFYRLLEDDSFIKETFLQLLKDDRALLGEVLSCVKEDNFELSKYLHNLLNPGLGELESVAKEVAKPAPKTEIRKRSQDPFDSTIDSLLAELGLGGEEKEFARKVNSQNGGGLPSSSSRS